MPRPLLFRLGVSRKLSSNAALLLQEQVVSAVTSHSSSNAYAFLCSPNDILVAVLGRVEPART